MKCQSKEISYSWGEVKCAVPNCDHNTYKTSGSKMCTCCTDIAFHEIGQVGFKTTHQTLFEKVAEYKNKNNPK